MQVNLAPADKLRLLEKKALKKIIPTAPGQRKVFARFNFFRQNLRGVLHFSQNMDNFFALIVGLYADEIHFDDI
jgi:hypothetical protein